MILIYSLSAHTATESSEVSGGLIASIAEILSPEFDQMTTAQQQAIINNWQFIIRKSAHFSIYALLGVLCSLPLSIYLRGKSLAVLALCIAWLYAISDEIHQYFVPGRSCEIRDVFIDWCGAALGVSVFLLICVFAQRNSIKSRN
jgi:VanZ family protein